MPAGFTIKNIEPNGLGTFPDTVRLMYWGWVVDLALKAKDRDLAEGLGADGEPMRDISEATRKHRKSAMTPSGRGSPSAPPLTPGGKLSRVRSLLAGRALLDRAEFWWRFDPFTHASFSIILTYQQEQGRDVFGLSESSVEEVRMQALRRWRTWLTTGQVVPVELEGKRVLAPLAATGTSGPLPAPRQLSELPGRAPTKDAVFGIGGTPAPGTQVRGFTEKEFKAYFRQTAPANVQSRPGQAYNRLLSHIWGHPGQGRSPGGVAPLVPRPPKPTVRPGNFKTVAHLEAWVKKTFPNATIEHKGIPITVWNEIANEMDFLARQYPEVAKELKYVGTTNGHWAKPGSQYAAAADIHHGRTIAFNPEHWENIEDVKRRNALADREGWHPAQVVDPRADVTHEWGHLVDAWINKSNAVTREATSAWRSLRNPFLVAVNSVDQKVDPAKAVSRYANTNDYEAVAEAFTAIRWQPEHLWTEPLRKFKAALETAIKLVRKAVK